MFTVDGVLLSPRPTSTSTLVLPHALVDVISQPREAPHVVLCLFLAAQVALAWLTYLCVPTTDQLTALAPGAHDAATKGFFSEVLSVCRRLPLFIALAFPVL